MVAAHAGWIPDSRPGYCVGNCGTKTTGNSDIQAWYSSHSPPSSEPGAGHDEVAKATAGAATKAGKTLVGAVPLCG